MERKHVFLGSLGVFFLFHSSQLIIQRFFSSNFGIAPQNLLGVFWGLQGIGRFCSHKQITMFFFDGLQSLNLTART